MKKTASVPFAFAMLPLAGALAVCQGEQAPDGRHEKVAAVDEVSVNANRDENMAAFPLPSPDSVLYMIYGYDGDGATSYKLPGGATVSYWYGHGFTLKGKTYYVGLTSKSNDEEGNVLADIEYRLEDGQVALGQATFVLNDEGNAWLRPDTDGYIGEFGRNDQPTAVDRSRKPMTHEVGDGRMLLAVPTQDFVNGISTRRYAIFLFDPDEVDDLTKFRGWGYLGSVGTGKDNEASCDEEIGRACAKSVGVLTFGGSGAAGLPELRVDFSDASGLENEKQVIYSFDTAAGEYRR